MQVPDQMGGECTYKADLGFLQQDRSKYLGACEYGDNQTLHQLIQTNLED